VLDWRDGVVLIAGGGALALAGLLAWQAGLGEQLPPGCGRGSGCEQVLTMHVAGISQVTEYLVIATGTSQRQLKSVAEEMRDLAKQEGQSVFRSDAGDGTGWVVIDFVDVVVHLFTAEQRAFYDLESLWGDGKQVDWVNRTTPGQFARLSSRRATVE